MKTSAKKNGTVQRKRKNKKQIPVFIIAAPFITLFLIVLLYVILVLPYTISNKMKNDIVTIFKPVDINDDPDYLLVKLTSAPDDLSQEKFIKKIGSSYDLTTGFEKISDDENLPVYRIRFFKDGAEYADIKEIYLFWNENNKDTETDSDAGIKDNPRPTIRKIEKEEKEIIKIRKTDIEKKVVSERNMENRITEKQNPNKKSVSKKTETPEDEEYAKISIIIDDVGYDYGTTYDFLDLDMPITFSIIPEMSDSKKFYDLIRKKNYDFILHIPMEPEKGPEYVEKNAILTNMGDEQIRNLMDTYIKEYPGALGANNHMGSKAVGDKRIMNLVINDLHKNNMFWLDSRTTLNSVAKESALEQRAKFYERDVFLDDDTSYEAIKGSMRTLINKARVNGSAIGIGHAQTKELGRVLKEFYDDRKTLKIKFVNLKNL
jgi:uncharacterized protein